jgi:hypothetical protein
MIGLRARFELHSRSQLSPGQAVVLITNPPIQQALAAVAMEYTNWTIDAGYQDGHGVIFQGNLIQGIYGRESPTDTLLTLYLADGDLGHNYGTVKTTLPPGSTPQQHLNVAMQALGPLGITLGYIGVDLSTPTYPRAVTLWGMARDILSNIAKSKNATVSYQQGKVMIVPQGQSAPGGVVVLNSQTGMIGMPSRTIEGIMVRCLINPANHIHGQVQINEADIQGTISPLLPTEGYGGTGSAPLSQSLLAPLSVGDGIYTIYKIDTHGDTRGNEWYQDLATLVAPLGAPSATTSAAAAPYLGVN